MYPNRLRITTDDEQQSNNKFKQFNVLTQYGLFDRVRNAWHQPPDTSESAKRIKEQFCSRMATYIVSMLNPFRKSDCKNAELPLQNTSNI